MYKRCMRVLPEKTGKRAVSQEKGYIVKQDLELYYQVPSDEIFEEVKRESIKIWETYDNEYGYVDKKVDRIRDMENVSDNMMFIVGMFDIYNQVKLMENLSAEARQAIEDRLPEDYFLQNYIFAKMIGL